MSAGGLRAAFPARVARWLSGWTLRARLLASLIALLALISVIVGGVSEFALRSHLLTQLDSTLQGFNGYAAGQQPPDRPVTGTGAISPGTGDNDPGAGPLRRQPPNSITVWFQNGEPYTGTALDGQYRSVTVTDTMSDALANVPPDHSIHTIHIPGHGDYRVQASYAHAPGSTPDSGSTVVVTGISLAEVNSSLVQLGFTIICVTIAGLIAVGLIGETIIRRTLRPLNRVAATASRVSELELDRGEVALSVRVPERDTDPRTEVGQVGASFNRMLGHVSEALTARQASETRVRQFVADASHELRTPLAAIRGYAELTRRIREEVPPDAAYAMSRVESESARMTTLVEDLLLLARLDSTAAGGVDAARPLDREPVDLTRLIVDVISDAHVAGPDHLWSLDVPPEPVTVAGDEPRLHQVLANLLSNARTHTPPGTKVRVTLIGEADGGARIEVADNGPGIPGSLLPDVFGRFARGDSSRSRAVGSTGLGLAIVAAVVEAHGGSVSVASEPGSTVFTVSLPGRDEIRPAADSAS